MKKICRREGVCIAKNPDRVCSAFSQLCKDVWMEIWMQVSRFYMQKKCNDKFSMNIHRSMDKVGCTKWEEKLSLAQWDRIEKNWLIRFGLQPTIELTFSQL